MDHQKSSKISQKTNVNSLPLYCLEQCPKVSGKSYEYFLNYAPYCVGVAARYVVPKQAFLSSGNISLSNHKNEKNTRTVPILKSNST